MGRADKDFACGAAELLAVFSFRFRAGDGKVVLESLECGRYVIVRRGWCAARL